MKPNSIGNAHVPSPVSSDTDAASSQQHAARSTQQQSHGTSRQDQMNPVLEGLADVPRSRLAGRVRFASWVGAIGDLTPEGKLSPGDPHFVPLDTRERKEKYPGAKYEPSSENRELMIQTNGNKAAERLYDSYKEKLPKVIKKFIKEGDPAYTKTIGSEEERKREGAIALKQYKNFKSDARQGNRFFPGLNYQHQKLNEPRNDRINHLRELEAAAAEEKGGASSSDS
ncbi:type III effector protein XopW [Xanthomonas campestris pv. badrii]|uniref:Type III effector protein XopW n=1 Tax=Xanthomonas campestris pv. badrii TaxID=149696 RepID=A0A7Z2ZFP7_XANCA|nr:type III secretion system effector XopW [Xanthomonas campestris]QJD66298.1 type III effector protein XopW [Xanthomonas campestris pv. badrii]